MPTTPAAPKGNLDPVAEAGGRGGGRPGTTIPPGPGRTFGGGGGGGIDPGGGGGGGGGGAGMIV